MGNVFYRKKIFFCVLKWKHEIFVLFINFNLSHVYNNTKIQSHFIFLINNSYDFLIIIYHITTNHEKKIENKKRKWEEIYF